MTRSLPGAVFAAALAFAAAPGQAGEYSRFVPLPVAAAHGPGTTEACTGIALMNLPPVWQAGDGAVVLVTAAPLQDATRDPLVAVLLNEHSAVVELVVGGPAHCEGDDPASSRLAPPADPLADLFGALRAVTRDAGAGLVVAVGYGPGGEFALQAVRDDVAARYLGAAAPRFAAAAALGNGAPGFALGASLPPRERAPERVAALCNALGEVAGGMPEAARPPALRAATACRDTMAAAMPAKERAEARR